MRRLRLDWIDRDGKLLILAGGVRAIAIVLAGAASVTELIYGGSSSTSRVVLLSISGLGFIPLMLFVSVFAEKIGRRRLLVALTLMSAAAVAALVVSSSTLILAPFVFLGALSRDSNGSLPIRALWMASLTDTASPPRRTDLYAVYYIAMSVIPFLGVLASMSVILTGLIVGALLGLSGAYEKTMLISSALLFLVEAYLYSRLSSGVEAPAEARNPMNPFKLPSRRVILTITGLLSLISLAGTMLFTSATFYSNINWSEERRMDIIFTNLSAVSLSSILVLPAIWLAAKIANRLGLVRTLVFFQMFWPLFFISTAYTSTGVLSVLLHVVYLVLREMSIPLSASFMMGVVARDERVATASIVFLGMGFLGLFGPVFAGILINIGQMAIPLVVGTALVIVANGALYRLFRNVKPPEEMERVVSDTLDEAQ